MQFIPFLCVFISDGALIWRRCQKFVSGRIILYDKRGRLLRWGFGVVPAIIYHWNAVPGSHLDETKIRTYFILRKTSYPELSCFPIPDIRHKDSMERQTRLKISKSPRIKFGLNLSCMKCRHRFWVLVKSVVVGKYMERLHLELEYSRVAVPFIVLTRPNILSFSNAQSFPSFQNKDMHIVAWVATKATHGPARVRLE